MTGRMVAYVSVGRTIDISGSGTFGSYGVHARLVSCEVAQGHGCQLFGAIQPAPQVRCLVPRQKVVLPPTGGTPASPIGPVQIGLVEPPRGTAARRVPGL